MNQKAAVTEDLATVPAADLVPEAVLAGGILNRARRFKKRADSVLEEVFRSLFEEIDTAKLKQEIAALRNENPDFDRIDYARALTRRASLRCAAAGAVTGLPSGVIALGSLGADLAYLVYQQFRLVLGISVVYGHEPSQRERFGEAFSCLAYGSGVGIGKQGIASVLESASAEGGMVAEKIGTRFARERIAKVIPFLGAITGGTLNYFAVRSVGRAAIRYYESLIDPDLAEAIWLDGDREGA